MRLARVALRKGGMQHAAEEVLPLFAAKPRKPCAHGLVHALQHFGARGKRDGAFRRLGGTLRALFRLGGVARKGCLAVRADGGNARIGRFPDLHDLGIGIGANLRDLRRRGVVNPFCNVHNAVHFVLRH